MKKFCLMCAAMALVALTSAVLLADDCAPCAQSAPCAAASCDAAAPCAAPAPCAARTARRCGFLGRYAGFGNASAANFGNACGAGFDVVNEEVAYTVKVPVWTDKEVEI